MRFVASVVPVSTNRMVCPLKEERSNSWDCFQLPVTSRFEKVLRLANLDVPAAFQISTFIVSKEPVVVVSSVRIRYQKLALTVVEFEGTTKIWDSTSAALLMPPNHACPAPDRALLRLS